MLSENWITEKIVDFEYKKYILLAYFQGVESEFKVNKLFPYYSDLQFHYSNLMDLWRKQVEMNNKFSKRIVGMDMKNKKLIYAHSFPKSIVIEELQDIVNYSIPKFKYYLETGKQIRQFVRKNVSIDLIGLEPIYKKEGYFLIHTKTAAETRIFKYSSSVRKENDSYYMHYSYVKSEKNSIINTPEKIKAKLILHYKELPNPATYWVESKFDFPFQETLLPVVSTIISKMI